MVALLVPIAFFVALVFVAEQLTRLFSNLSLNRTLREALRSDPGSVPVLAERLDARQPYADALVGWIFIAFAVGLLLMGLFEPDAGARREVIRTAIVPLVVGVVVLAYVRRAKRVADVATPAQALPPPTPKRRTRQA